MLRMAKRRAPTAGPLGSRPILRPGGRLAHAKAITAHESYRITRLYDRWAATLTLDGIEMTIVLSMLRVTNLHLPMQPANHQKS